MRLSGFPFFPVFSTVVLAVACAGVSGEVRLTASSGISMSRELPNERDFEYLLAPAARIGALLFGPKGPPLLVDVGYVAKGYHAEQYRVEIGGPGGPITDPTTFDDRFHYLSFAIGTAFSPGGDRFELRFPVGLRMEALVTRYVHVDDWYEVDPTERTSRFTLAAAVGVVPAVKLGEIWLTLEMGAAFDLSMTNLDTEYDGDPVRFYTLGALLGVAVPVGKRRD